MSLRRTLILAAAAISLAALAALWLTDQWVVRARLLTLEDDTAQRRFELVTQTLSREAHALAVLQKDWAFWDDTYDYLLTRNPEFVARNLPVATFRDTGLSALFLYDAQGMPVWQGSYDRDGRAREDLIDFPPDAPPRRSELIALGERPTEQHVGLMLTSAGPALVASSAVLTSASSGKPRGALVMLRLLDETLIATLRETTATEFSLTAATTGATKNRIQRTDADRLNIEGPLTDVFGDSSLQLAVQLPRTAFHLQRTASLSFAWVMAAIVLGSFGLLLCAVRRMVIAPILALSGHADRLRRSGDFSLRVGTTRRDEIGALAVQLDTLMSEVERRSEELRQLALIDPLTGALNRRAFNLQLERMWDQHAKQGLPLALVMCDVDHFKHYNDRYGHPAGDTFLKGLADCLLRQIRAGTDGLFRLGGDEFAILIPGAGLQAAASMSEKLCAQVHELRIPHSGVAVARHVTICAGAASLVPGTGMTSQSLIDRADQALFQAKHGGRNRARAASGATAAPDPRGVHHDVANAGS